MEQPQALYALGLGLLLRYLAPERGDAFRVVEHEATKTTLLAGRRHGRNDLFQDNFELAGRGQVQEVCKRPFRALGKQGRGCEEVGRVPLDLMNKRDGNFRKPKRCSKK